MCHHKVGFVEKVAYILSVEFKRKWPVSHTAKFTIAVERCGMAGSAASCRLSWAWKRQVIIFHHFVIRGGFSFDWCKVRMTVEVLNIPSSLWKR
jgi:hypothetical protein